MSHTPGPWYAKPHPEYPFGKVRVCNRHDAEYGDFHEIAYVRPNNAALIAAAPDMLEVLEEIDGCAAYWSEYDVPLGLHERIKDAIKKAKGER